MKNLIKLAALALPLALGAPVFAQETAKPKEEFPIGTTPEVKVGDIYVKNTEGDWQVRCVKVETGAEPCHIYQLIKDAEGNSVAEMTVFHLPGGGAAVAGANVMTPLGTMLKNQMLFKVDDGKAQSYAYDWCENVGCIARMGFTGLELEALKRGTAATITISSVVAPTQAIGLPVSLNGFSAAFTAVLVKE